MTEILDESPPFPPPTCWWDLAPAEYEATRTDLEAWVRDFARHTRVPASLLPPCWPRHPELVWLWGALRDYAAFAFHPLQMSSEAIGFVRAWETIHHQLREAVANLTCTATTHHDRPAARWTGLDADTTRNSQGTHREKESLR